MVSIRFGLEDDIGRDKFLFLLVFIWSRRVGFFLVRSSGRVAMMACRYGHDRKFLTVSIRCGKDLMSVRREPGRNHM